MSNKPRKSTKKKRIDEAMSRRTGVVDENRRRLGIGFMLVVLMFSVLTFRLAYWQIVRGDDLNEKATEMLDQDTTIAPVRRTI